MPAAPKVNPVLPIPTVPRPPDNADQYRLLRPFSQSASLPAPPAITLPSTAVDSFVSSPYVSPIQSSHVDAPAMSRSQWQTPSPISSPLQLEFSLPTAFFRSLPDTASAEASLLFASPVSSGNISAPPFPLSTPPEIVHSPALSYSGGRSLPSHLPPEKLRLSTSDHLSAVIRSIDDHFERLGGFGGFLDAFVNTEPVSVKHEHMRTRWLSGRCSKKPIHLIKDIYSHRTCRPTADEKTRLFDANCDPDELRSTKVAISVWSTQIVGNRCIDEVGKLGYDDPRYAHPKHPEFRAHIQVSANERTKAKKKTVTENDITNFSMQRTIDVLKHRAPTTWYLTECMAARRAPGKETALAKKRPHTFIQAVTMSMFAISRNKAATGYFALAFGVWLFSSNAHSNIKRIMCRLGLSVHDTTVRSALVTITSARRENLQALTAASLRTRQPYCRNLLDNIQKYQIVFEQGIGKTSEMITGTAGTALRLDNCSPDAFHLKPYQLAYVKNERAKLTTSILHADIDFSHLHGVFALHLVQVLCTHVPELAPYLKLISVRFCSAPVAKHRMPLQKTGIIALGSNGYQEMETTGMKETVKDFDAQEGYTSENVASASILLWNAGDVGSFTAFWRVLRHLLPQAASRNTYESFEGRIFTPGFFHTRMHLVDEIAHLHFASKTTKDPSSLSRSAMATGLHIPNPNTSCDFYPTTRTMDTIFDAQVLDLWSLELAAHLDLRAHFKAAALRKDLPSFDALITTAESLVKRYATIMGFTAAMSSARQATCPADLKFSVASTPPSPNLSPPVADTPEFTGDRTLANSILFKQHFLLYRELSHAVKEGDTGRIMEVSKMLIFIFAGAGKHNYTTALLEVYCLFRYEASPNLKTAILNNWLINIAGEPGKYLEDDHLQEHHIRFLVDMMSGSIGSFDQSFFRNIISPNVRFFLDNRQEFDATFELKSGGKQHTSADVKDETRVLMKMYREEQLHLFQSGRDFEHAAKNVFNAGYKILDGGKMRDFQTNSTTRATVLRSLRKINTETSSPPAATYVPPDQFEDSRGDDGVGSDGMDDEMCDEQRADSPGAVSHGNESMDEDEGNLNADFETEGEE